VNYVEIKGLDSEVARQKRRLFRQLGKRLYLIHSKRQSIARGLVRLGRGE